MAGKQIFRALLTLLILFSPSAYGSSVSGGDLVSSTVVVLAPGVVFEQNIEVGNAPLILNILKVDLKRKGVRVLAGQANEIVSIKSPYNGRQTISAISRQQDALAAVNADFFPYTGDPLGLEIRNGELLSESMDYRVCMGISKGGAKFAVLTTLGSWSSRALEGRLQGINRLPGASEVTLLTSSFNGETPLPRSMELIPVTGMNSPVKVSKEVAGVTEESISMRIGDILPHCKKNSAFLAIGSKADTALRELTSPGEKISMLFDLTPTAPSPLLGKYESALPASGESRTIVWNDVQEAVSGGPWLVKEGKLFVDGEAERMDQETFVRMRHPRTAVGITAKHLLLLVTADGRSKWSRGASLIEMAQIMLRLGAVNAINLDGGGSTTMVVKDHVVNAPSDGLERPVANGLLVFSGRGVASDELPEVGAEERAIQQGVPTPLELNMPASERKSLVWGTEHGFGFISQSGVFQCDKPGSGIAFAVASRRTYVFPIKVVP